MLIIIIFIGAILWIGSGLLANVYYNRKSFWKYPELYSGSEELFPWPIAILFGPMHLLVEWMSRDTRYPPIPQGIKSRPRVDEVAEQVARTKAKLNLP